MISIIITAFREAEQIKTALNSILNPEWNDYKGDFEVLVTCPDKETWLAAKQTALKFKFQSIKWIKDPGKGKPHALNLAFEKAKGEIFVLTDADVYFAKSAVSRLVKHFKDKDVGGVTGRAKSIDSKDNFMGYMGHLLADAAHHKRLVTMKGHKSGKSLKIVSKEPGFYMLSGYILAMRNVGIDVPENCLVEDAYMSYELHNKGYKLKYEPDAIVYVKYAGHLNDWFKQKLRSVGGYVQLRKFGIIKKDTEVRDFGRELQYFWFPLKYAKSLKQLVWSFCMFPIRLWLWIRVFYEQRIKRKSFEETWVRVESTK